MSKIRFSINKETLFVDSHESKDYILTYVPNSKRQNYVLLKRSDIVSEDDKTIIVEFRDTRNIAMWKGMPSMEQAIHVYESQDYSDSAVLSITANDLYEDYYDYNPNYDTTKKSKSDARRQAREQAYTSRKSQANKQEADLSKTSKQQKATPLPKQEAKSVQTNRTYYSNEQFKEIRLGAIQKMDISKYANPDFDASQMKELRLALKAGIDITQYNSPQVSAAAMKQIRLGVRHGIHLKFDDIQVKDYDAEQIKEILAAAKRQLNLKPLLNPDFEATQMREIRLGLQAGLDITRYDNVHFSPEQMHILRLQLVVERIKDIIMEALRHTLSTFRVWTAERMTDATLYLQNKITPQIENVAENSELAISGSHEDYSEQIKEQLTKMISAIQNNNPDIEILAGETTNEICRIIGLDNGLNSEVISSENDLSDSIAYVDKENLAQMVEEQLNQVQISEEMDLAMEG